MVTTFAHGAESFVGPVHFGVVGLASGQTAQLNVVALQPGAPDHATLQFWTADGKILKQEAVRLVVGKAASLRFDRWEASAVGDVNGGNLRMSIQPAVMFDANASNPELVHAQLEVFDAAGQTMFVYPGSTRFPSEVDGQHLFGLVGMVGGQTARLTATHISLAATRDLSTDQLPAVQLQLFDAEGKVVAEWNGRATPNRSISLDWLIPDGTSNRTHVRGVITINGMSKGGANRTTKAGTFLGTLEVLDSRTGMTHIVELPAVQ